MPDVNSILVVDDEANLRRSLLLILERSGYRVKTAGTAAEGLKQLTLDTFDLMFLDIKLPDREGTSILPEIRKLYPDMAVLILTAHASLDTAIEAVRLGARDYLLKPVNPEKLLERTREVMAEQAQPRRRRELTAQVQTLLADLTHLDGNEPAVPPVAAPAPALDPSRFLKCGELSVDLRTRQAFLDKRTIPLSPSNFDYLVTLMRHAPDAVPYQTLVKESQGYELTRSEAREICRWQIHELRKALEDNPHKPCFVLTVRDVGYSLVD